MSDKSFGDHMNRGIVKNPLLSTAVTGMSIEDLTQNAVLLPVSRTQELLGRQEQATQNVTLAHHPSVNQNQSGDARFTPIHPPDAQNAKTDDFDVNEYFARLQGTIYVSAPLNSHIKDDANTNIETKEENLEEINLNEPVNDVQQSLTADIAQNFSQLPTALPQMASAVFSSFSSMLSMKSREHTPEERREPVGYAQEVPLMGVSEREVAPPPREPLREPPISGPGNFRLTTKKKYAQIPGLSSGESAQMPTYTPPAFNQPIFTPPQQKITDNFTITENNAPKLDAGQSNVDFNVFSNTAQSIPIETVNQPNVFEVPKEDGSNLVATPQFTQDYSRQGAIIPPPPMFSNLAKRDSSPNVGRTILPPSVARRIGSNKPTISNQAQAFTAFDNILVPAPVSDTESLLPPNESQSSIIPSQALNPSATMSVPPYASQGVISQPGLLPSVPMPPTKIVSPANVPTNVSLATPPVSVTMPTNVTSVVGISPYPGNLPPPLTNTFVAPTANNSHTTVRSLTSYAESASILSPPQSYGNQSQPVAPPPSFSENQSQATQNIPPPASFPPSNKASSSIAPPQMFNPYMQEQPLTSQPTVLTFEEINKHESILKSGNIESKITQMFTTPAAEPLKIPDPPKASGSTNFRMTKKRPQYYSGPIEGVGAISNNVKPTLTPIATTAFQGAVFTPDANIGYQAAVFTPENITENEHSTHGAIFNPGVTESSNQSSMFTPLGVNVETPNIQYAFDINKPADNAGFTPFDVNKAPEPYSSNNTAFDMSRQEADTYEPPKQESAFGIIGSLKSKLSSIDINKLQNSVTTFFDPAYNAAKTETAKEYEPTYGQNQGIEIFVPNPETHPQPYNYDAHQSSFTYGQGTIPNPSNYYNQQTHNVYSTNSFYSQPSYGTQSYSQTNLQGQQGVNEHFNIPYTTPIVDSELSQTVNVATYQPNLAGYVQANVIENTVGNNFDVSQGSTEAVPTMPITSGNDDNMTAGFRAESNVLEIAKSQKEKNIENTMKNLQIKDEVNTNFETVNLTAEQVVLNKEILQTVNFVDPVEDVSSSPIAEKAFLNVVHRKINVNFFDTLENADKLNVDCAPKGSNLDNMFSAPLHDLSSIIADKSKEISDGVSDIDDEVSGNTNEEEVDCQSVNDRLMALADYDDDDSQPSETGPTTDLNICETCREVNQPEQKSADFTSQLIENIIAPIQLSNPVEAPLTETHSALPDNFDTINQGAEISLIADETIETLQIQSAAELLDEDENTNIETNYGWRTEVPLPLGQDLLDHDYTFTANPNAIGFFANNNLFFDNMPNNASDEIKAEFKVSQDEPPIVLQRQMSIPTAPPAEDSEDAKSDETGVLDVLSIEQDASKDFPVFEEYVIEPSETDDDKIELKEKNDEVKDTFTNRVDRFKKIEGGEDSTEQKDFNFVNSNTMMPSYFDTGNYAVETHFKNSRVSPTISKIPPGFEDHYELMPKSKQYVPMKVPETTTQTNLTTTVSEAHTKTEIITSTVSSSIEPAPEPQPEAKLPDFASVFGAKIELQDTSVSDTEEPEEIPANPVNPQVNIEDKVQDKKIPTLPDPINFFASSAQESEATEGVNRLASYFASPAKTDNTKSFFELSQSQNHYRQDKDKIEGHKTFFELSQSQDHYKKNITNIPHDKCIANINLINDLTSCQNIEPATEQIVRTVNYFTVEYDNPDLNFNKGEPSVTLNKKTDTYITREKESEIEETVLNHDEMLTEIVNNCKYCCQSGPVLTVREIDFDSIGKVNFRQAMDTASNPKDPSSSRPPGQKQAGKEEGRSVSVAMDDVSSDGDSSEGVAIMTENRSTNDYEPVKHHWFYRVDCEEKSIWRGFSTSDSRAIETVLHSPDLNENTLVPTDGGRYDVNVVGRLRIAVYWSEKPTNVRRCSWFYKGTTDARYVPYTEGVAEKLEIEYRHGITTGEWHRRLVLPNNELVVMHGPAVMVHFLQGGSADAFSTPNLFFGKRVYRNPPKFKFSPDPSARIDHLLLLVHGAGECRNQRDKIQSTMRPRVVRRSIDESEIEDTEPSSIDHLLLLCHGVGSACDMRFRSVEEVVDDFRTTSMQLLQSHYRNSYDNGVVSRVEVLPISWHASLHSGPKGVDRRLARVTLASIPRLRSFTNDTVLDVLFYTSPHYCQMILDTVCSELNRIYTLFMKRNPDFKGEVSLGGHSLGSVILYDLLCNQPVPGPLKSRSEKTYLTGTLANNPTMQYPTLCFQPLALYALGSPIAIFECIRGVEMLGGEFYLPTCRNFFNIFHPYDPIAYRIEPLVNPQLQNVKPSLIPHHKGRKRMHLELKDTMARVGADLKQKLLESIKSTWSSMWASAAPPDHQLEKVVEEEIEKEQLEEENSKEEPMQADVTPGEMLGRLNSGRRIDYVLQEAPFEMINEYLFAMTSHVCYWESEDVMLLILREIYDSMGVQPDVVVPQQSMTVQRVTVVRDDERVVSNTADASTSRVS